MEMEYRETNRRGKAIIVMGLLLAILAGGAAFFVINQAQQSAGQGSLQKDLRLELMPTIETSLGPIRYPVPVVVSRAVAPR